MRESTFKAGFARVDITPPLGTPIVGYFEERRARGILDNLEANAVAFSDGERAAVMIAADLLGIEGVEFNAALRRRVAEATGVSDEAVYIHCTHTHTGPGAGRAGKGRTDFFDGTDFYNEFLSFRLCDVARMAMDDLTPASLSAGAAEARRISFIRRYRMKDGSIRTNPGVGNPDISDSVGTADETVRILRVRREGKSDIAVLGFATHPDVVGGEMVSGDWPAFARRVFERAVPGARCIFFNGAQGDVNHVCVDPRPGECEGLHPDFDGVDRGYDHARHMGRVVAAAAMSAWDKCEHLPSGPIRFKVLSVSVPAQRPEPGDVPKAREYVRLHREGRDGEIPFKGMELTTVVAESERMLLLKDGPDAFDLPLSLVAIGDSVAFAGMPGEPFTDIGRAVVERSPAKVTFCTCLTNASCGYFPVADAYAEGGYEARSSIFAPSVAEDLIAGQLRLLVELAK